jgi:hypothetical protein
MWVSGRLHVRAALPSRKDRGIHPTEGSVDPRTGVGSVREKELSSTEQYFQIPSLRDDAKLQIAAEPVVTGLRLADYQRRGHPSRRTSFRNTQIFLFLY